MMEGVLSRLLESVLFGIIMLIGMYIVAFLLKLYNNIVEFINKAEARAEARAKARDELALKIKINTDPALCATFLTISITKHIFGIK